MAYKIGNVHFFLPEEQVREQLFHMFNGNLGHSVKHPNIKANYYCDLCYLFDWDCTDDEEFWADLHSEYEYARDVYHPDLPEVIERIQTAVTKYLTENGAGHLLPTQTIPVDLMWE